MTPRPVIPLRPVPAASPARAAPPVDTHWRARYLLLAPHRLGFALAMLVLAAAGLWWALVQLDRSTQWLGLAYAVSPTLAHATVMTFGFVPLFFSGFLMTAGPKWLGLPPVPATALLGPGLLQAAGWPLWLAGTHLSVRLALAGLVLACAGLGWLSMQFWQLILRSREPDRVHALTIGVAFAMGTLCLAVLALGVAIDAPRLSLACVRTGLWGFVVVVFVTVAHRMIPFFTSSAMPMTTAWRPFWALWLMLAAAALEAVSPWVILVLFIRGSSLFGWMLGRGLLEVVAGGALIWLACAWGLMQSLRNKLLAMLHIGFGWLGIAMLLGGISQAAGAAQGVPTLGLAPLHAMSMGCLGSLILAMVTRVSCGHSGRALVADRIVWSLFCLLQLATLLRIAAATEFAAGSPLTLAAALLWAGVMAVWAARLGGWYGRLRADGLPG